VNHWWTEPEDELLPFCLDACLYWAPLIICQEGAVWCAKKAAYVEPGRECRDYKERK